MLIDPVLAFIKAYRLRGSTECLKSAATSKFDDVLMCKAKKSLWDAREDVLSAAGLAYQSRRGSERRTQASADLDDILTALDKLDETENGIPDIFCEAADLVRIPPVVVDDCTELVQRNGLSLGNITSKLEALSSDIAALSSKLTTLEPPSLPRNVIRPHRDSTGDRQAASPPASNSRLDRHENLMVFGLDESQSMSDTMTSVQTMLQFVTGRSTPVKDLFRIGKLRKSGADGDQAAPIRPRPIVLKLVSPWDRRLVLANRFKLKEYSTKGIFVREDLSPEVRQQQRDKYTARKSSLTVQ